MGVSQIHALGRNRKFYVNEEATFGTFAKPAGTDAAVILNATFTPAQERKVRDDARSSRSALEQITGKKSATWTVESYVLPSGSAGTAPDLGPLFKGAMGTETVSGGSRVTYSLNTNQDLGSFSLVQFFNETFMESLTGCYVNSMTISIAGGEEPKVTFEGESSGTYIPTTSSPNATQLAAGETFATVSGSGTAATFNVHTGEGKNFKVGSVISVATDTDLEVTGVSGDAITVDSSITFADDDDIKPFVPTETVAGSPIAGILGSLTLAGTSLPITAFEVTVANNMKGIADEAFVTGTSDYVPGFRDVTGSLSIRCRRDLAIEIGKRLDFGTQAIVVTCGDTAGKKLIVEIDDAEFEVAAVDTPQSDEVVIPMTFRALATSAGEDEIVIKFE